MYRLELTNGGDERENRRNGPGLCKRPPLSLSFSSLFPNLESFKEAQIFYLAAPGAEQVAVGAGFICVLYNCAVAS
jgi:hypothetical protein